MLNKIRHIPGARNTYHKVRRNLRVAKPYRFENRSKSSKMLCMVIAGYKEFTWAKVFDRLSEYIPDGIDVCIASSGVNNDRLATIAEKHNWSYLSTKRNNVSLLQNTVIANFPNAEKIFKMDEDIFVTKDLFQTLQDTLQQVSLPDSPYNPGFVAPLIPLNGYGYHQILKKLNLEQDFRDRFGQIKMAAGPSEEIEKNLDVAKYFWSAQGSPVPKIDDLNTVLHQQPFSYTICPIRFSIGLILFKRDLWNDMNYFKVGMGNAMGVDEVDIDTFCMMKSKCIIVSSNCAVGHLSFGVQNPGMKEFYLAHQENF